MTPSKPSNTPARDFKVWAEYFSVPTKAKPDKELASAKGRHASAMKKVKALLANNPRIDVNKGYCDYYVTCDGIDPEDPADPLYDQHICVGGEEVLEAVQVYVDHLVGVK
jgi:hypothetical protein